MEHPKPVHTDEEQAESREGRRVYIIEIMEKWHDLVAPGLPDNKRCYYVGETGKDVSERFYEHKSDRTKPGRRPKRRARVFDKIGKENGGRTLRKNIDVVLRRGMMQAYDPQPDVHLAEALEASVVDELRRQGHCVYPRGVGTTPFDSYRDEVF